MGEADLDRRILEFLREFTGDFRFKSEGEVFSLNSLENEVKEIIIIIFSKEMQIYY